LFNQLKTNCAANGVRLWIAIGGWGLSGNFPGVAANATRRATLASQCLNLCTTHGLAGIDIDWEFPALSDKTNFTAMLAAIKAQLGTTYKLSAALGGESFNYSCIASGHAVGVEAAAFTHLDFFNIMSYDAPTCFANHTSLDFMQRAMNGWNALGCPYSKMIPGMAFYTRGSAVDMWKDVATTTRFNDADGIDGGLNFDSKPTIEAKTNWAMCTMGAPGIMTWELSQDLPGSNALNLTTVMFNAATACACPFSDPALGADQSLCGTGGTIVLNSGIATNSPSRTFTWKRDGTTVVNASTTATTYNATTAGTYEVIVTEGTCSKNDVIIITATLPTPSLGSDQALCSPSSYTLSPSNVASFPGTTSWSWSKDGSPLGITTSSLTFVRGGGTYRLTASISGCTSTFDDVVLSSTQPTPNDVCLSAAGTANLSISNVGAGPYNWYSNPSGGSVLSTGTSYSPSVASTDTFWVQEGTGSNYFVGLNTVPAGWDGPGSDAEGFNFTVSNNTVTISEVDVYVPAWTNTTGIFVKILNSTGSSTLFTGPSVNYNNSGTGSIIKLTLTVGASLAPGSYRLAVNSTGNLKHGPSGSFPYTVNDVSITSMFGVASWPFAFNWKIGGSSACARLGVIAKIGGCSLPAPVQMSSFAADRNGNAVHLNWTTSSEDNNDYFAVQRSIDGVNFSTIGNVDGAGTSNQVNAYFFSDANAPSGIVYYRIAQVDFSGATSFSEIKSVNASLVLSISPNPFSGSTSLSLAGSGLAEIRILDLQGKVLEDQQFEVGKNIELGASLSAGIYLLEILHEGQIYVQKLFKQ
jgi:hypothetical protein